MPVHAAVEDEQPPAAGQCWCCGAREDPDRLVHLGNHPEVGLCVRCAHAVSKRAGEIEDRSRTGVAVAGRNQVRRLRKAVVARGWHRNKVVGRGLRWLGRFTP